MVRRRRDSTWVPGRREIVAAGSFLLFVVGAVIVAFGIAKWTPLVIVLGVVAMALPIMRWFRIRREPDGTWTFEGEMEKPPDSASEPPADERSRHSG